MSVAELESARGAGGEARPAPGTEPYLGADGNFTAGWTERLPQELSEFAGGVAKYRSLPELVKGYGNLQRKLGQNSRGVLVPAADSEDAVVQAFRKAVGAPEDAEGYGLGSAPQGELESWDGEFGAKVEAVLHRHHAPKALAEELGNLEAERVMQYEANLEQEQASYLEEQEGKLREAWGGEYELKKAQAMDAAAAFGLDLAQADEADLGLVFARLHELLSEDDKVRHALGIELPTLAGGGGGLGGRARAQDIMSNPNNPLHARYQGGDAEVRRTVHLLLQQG